MWPHDCPVEKTRISIGEGESCNWCGKSQPQPRKEIVMAEKQTIVINDIEYTEDQLTGLQRVIINHVAGLAQYL
jgi:hypothetical protein